MKTSRWAGVGMVLGALTALVWQAPASWLASGVQALSQERVQLRQPQGTVWHGSAQWVLSSGAGGQDALALPQRLTWQLQPQADASLRLELSLPCCTPEPLRLWFRPTWTGVTREFGDGSSQWPLAWLGGLGAPWNTLGLEGQARLKIQSLRLQWQSGTWQLQGQAQLQLQSVASRLSTLRPLGDYALDLQGGTSARGPDNNDSCAERNRRGGNPRANPVLARGGGGGFEGRRAGREGLMRQAPPHSTVPPGHAPNV
jgi:general secretion pathway protein N